jgi:hypothetical protein
MACKNEVNVSEKAFAELLSKHLRRGPHPSGETCEPWTYVTFAAKWRSSRAGETRPTIAYQINRQRSLIAAIIGRLVEDRQPFLRFRINWRDSRAIPGRPRQRLGSSLRGRANLARTNLNPIVPGI